MRCLETAPRSRQRVSALLLFLALCRRASASAASRGYNCTASSGADTCLNVLDGNITSAWVVTGPGPHWIEVITGGGEFVRLGGYSVTAPVTIVAASPPTAWRLEGREPAVSIIDEVSGKSLQAGQTLPRELSGWSYYRRVRLTIQQPLGQAVGLAELQLIQKVEYAFDVGVWQDCSVTCGGGTQQREVACKDEEGTKYNDARCSGVQVPERTRTCGLGLCDCKGGLACTASCSESSRTHDQLGCAVLIDGMQATTWTSSGPAPQWVEFDLAEQKEVVEFSVTVGVSPESISVEAPKRFSLQATEHGASNPLRSWIEMWSVADMGRSWETVQERRWPVVPNPQSFGGTKFRYWRIAVQEAMGGATSPVSLAEVGFFAPPDSYELKIGPWSSCKPYAGNGSCGVGLSTRSVDCFTRDGRPRPINLCVNGTMPVSEQSCNVDCPWLVVHNADARQDFYGVMRVELSPEWRALLVCAAWKAPFGGWHPGAAEIDDAVYKASFLCEFGNCTMDIWGIQVDAPEGSEFEVRCKVAGGTQVAGAGKRGILHATPELLGCFADQRSPRRDLPEERGTQTQVNCAHECFGHRYFGMQFLGECFCGDAYGMYGEQKANYSLGLTGCDCNGPYFGFWANCIWHQTTGRYGEEANIPIRLISKTTTRAELFVIIEPTANLHCNITTDASSNIPPKTGASCSGGGCNLVIDSLLPATTYTVSCEAAALEAHLRPRRAALLVRTQDLPVIPPPKPTPPPVINLLGAEDTRDATSTTLAPEVEKGVAPWGWMTATSIFLGCMALPLSFLCCSRSPRNSAIEALDFPHTFWLAWDLMLAADMALGYIFLEHLLYSRAEGPEPYWDDLSTTVAGCLLVSIVLHSVAFLAYGLAPSLVRFLVLKSREGVQMSRHRYRSAPGQGLRRRAGKSSNPNGLAAALPPDLDDHDGGVSCLHFLPGLSALAICVAQGGEIREVAARKVGLRGMQLILSLGQAVSAGLYLNQRWPVPTSYPLSLGCISMTSAMAVILVIVMLRARAVGGEGLFLLDQNESGPISAFDEPRALEAAQTRKNRSKKGSRNEKAQLAPPPPPPLASASDSKLRAGALAVTPPRTMESPSWRVAPRRGEQPKPMPEILGAG